MFSGTKRKLWEQGKRSETSFMHVMEMERLKTKCNVTRKNSEERISELWSWSESRSRGFDAICTASTVGAYSVLEGRRDKGRPCLSWLGGIKKEAVQGRT